MKAGATYNLIVKLPEITDEPSEQEIIDEIIFTIKCGSVVLSKVYPSDVSLDGDIYIIPLNQSETKQLVGNCQLEAQVNYTNKAVQKSYIQSFTVSDTLATKDVEGVPDSVHNSELILKLIGSDVLVISIVPEVADEIIKNMNELYLATKQAMEDTESYGEQTKSDLLNAYNNYISQLQAKLQDSLNSIDSVTSGKLTDIANSAVSQLEAINNTAVAQINSINTTAQTQITAIDSLVNAKMTDIDSLVNAKLSDINSTASQQLVNINNTAQAQLNAINTTAQAQASALDEQADYIYGNMGISPRNAEIVTGSGSGKIDVSSYTTLKLDNLVIKNSQTVVGENLYLRVSTYKGETESLDNYIRELGGTLDISDVDYIELWVQYSGGSGYTGVVDYTLLEYDVRAKIDDLEARVTALENKEEV